MLDAADILFWIIQVFREDWSDQAFLGFVTEVDDVLNPQQTICAFRNGPNSMRPEEVPYTPETIRDRVRVFAAGEWLKRSAHRFAAEPPREPSGPNLEDRDWQKAVEVEPRLARLEEAVLAEAAQRQANGTYNPDRLYYDTKPYLAALLGSQRGRDPQTRYSQEQPYEAHFDAAIEGKPTTSPEHDLWLQEQVVLDRAWTRIYDLLVGL
jgi:hypothetical protein